MHTLLERSKELAAITTLLADARRGAGRALLVDGPPGIGKTSLIAAALDEAGRADMAAFIARGAELEQAFPFGVVRQLYERAVLSAAADGGASKLAGAAGLCAPVFGLPRPQGLLPPANEQEAALLGLYWLAVELSEKRPVLLAIDDVQWADAPSVRWMAYTLRRLGGLRAAMLLTARGGELSDDARAALLADGTVEVVVPQPLGETAVGEMLATQTGSAIAPSIRRACHAATAGNPLLVREVGRALAATGTVGDATQPEDVVGRSSQRLARLIDARLDRLPAGAGALARASAILGPDAELRHAAKLVDLSPAAAAVAADALRRADVLTADTRLTFTHPLVREVTYGALAPGRRASWHARAARLLAEADASVERVGAQLMHSEPASDAWVTGRLREAATDALARGAPQTAVALLRRAVAEGAPGDRGALLWLLGDAEGRMLDAAAGPHLKEAYRLATGPQDRSGIALSLARVLLTSGDVADASAVMRTAIADAAEVDADLALRLEVMLAFSGHMGPVDHGDGTSRFAGRSARGVAGATPGERAFVAFLAGEAACVGRPAEVGVDLALRALSGGTLLAQETCESPLFLLACTALTWFGALTLARPHVDAAVHDARARGSELGFAQALAWQADVSLREGRVREAEGQARASLQVATPHAAIARAVAMACLVVSLLEQGRGGEAREVLAESGYDGPLAAQGPLGSVQYARGLQRLWARDRSGALADMEGAGRIYLQAGIPAPLVAPWRSSAGRVHAALGARERARQLVDDELERARTAAAPRAIGIGLRAIATLEHPRNAVEPLREAVHALELSDARLDHAHALCDLGMNLRRAGAPRDARDPLRLAVDLAASCGATALLDRARGELLAAGARPRRITVFGRDALTPSELRVAELAREGLTNREIAQDLFVTVKTVESQLGHAFSKLGIHSRRDLADALGAEAAGANAPER